MGGSKFCKNADMRFSSAGVVFLLTALTWPLEAGLLVEFGVRGNALELPNCVLMLTNFAGERGDSIMTTGGNVCDGVADIMDCGRACGGLGRS